MSEKKAVASFAGLGVQQVKDLVEKGMSLDHVRELAEAGFTFEQIDEIADVMPSTGGSGAGLSKDDIREIVGGAAKAASEAGAEGMRRVLHPQNAQHPGISVFSYPEGDVARPKPALTRKAYFCGSLLDAKQMTPREIEAVNAITSSRTARDGRWTADLVQNGRDTELHIVVPCKTIDDRMNLPSLELICVELTQGQAAVDPLSLAERVKELEARLASVG